MTATHNQALLDLRREAQKATKLRPRFKDAFKDTGLATMTRPYCQKGCLLFGEGDLVLIDPVPEKLFGPNGVIRPFYWTWAATEKKFVLLNGDHLKVIRR